MVELYYENSEFSYKWSEIFIMRIYNRLLLNIL